MASLAKNNRNIITPKEKKVVLENFISLTTLQGINYFLPIIVLPYLIRIIGAEKFGLIAFAQAFIQYFMILTEYGFNLSATREISLCKEGKKEVCKIFSAVMSAKIILAGAAFLILLLVINFIPRFKSDWIVYILSFGAVIGNTLFPVWFFQGKEKMTYITVINVAGGLIYALLIFLCVKDAQDYLYVPVLNSFYFIITGLIGLFVVFKKFKIEFIVQTYGNVKAELKKGWDIFISNVAINTYTTTRIFAVGLLTNNILTGYYTVAERVAGLIQAFPLLSFSQAIYPRMSKIFLKNKKRAIYLMRKIQDSTTSIFAIVIPIIFLLTPMITRILCGIESQEAITSLRLLLVSAFFVGANAFKVQFLLVCGRADLYSKIHVLAALIGLPLVFILITYYSFLGAALSAVLLEIGIFILTFRFIEKFG